MEENKTTTVKTNDKAIIEAEGAGVTAGTIARTVCLVLALINQVLAIFGHESIPIADDMVYQAVSIGFTVVTALVTWWKNNSFTSAAQVGDSTMKQLKGK